MTEPNPESRTYLFLAAAKLLEVATTLDPPEPKTAVQAATLVLHHATGVTYTDVLAYAALKRAPAPTAEEYEQLLTKASGIVVSSNRRGVSH